MLRLGLTGGIGSGKSTVAQMLVDAGAARIDADEISRASTASGGLAIPQIAAQFGPQAITPEGAMNREVMRQQVFANPSAKSKLEAIIHPMVSIQSARLANVALQDGCALLVFDIPLLVESKRWRQQLDKVLVVDCEEATQISRVLARQSAGSAEKGWTRDMAQTVMNQQATRAQRLAAADMVIYNEGLTLVELAEQVKQIAQRITL